MYTEQQLILKPKHQMVVNPIYRQQTVSSLDHNIYFHWFQISMSAQIHLIPTAVMATQCVITSIVVMSVCVTLGSVLTMTREAVQVNRSILSSHGRKSWGGGEGGGEGIENHSK